MHLREIHLPHRLYLEVGLHTELIYEFSNVCHAHALVLSRALHKRHRLVVPNHRDEVLVVHGVWHVLHHALVREGEEVQ